jgi:YD repeat-containing protein
MQRVTSTVEKTAGGVVITGFEYIYDDLSRIIEEKVLANSTKMCYTYDDLSRVTARTVKKLSDNSMASRSPEPAPAR